MNKETDYIRRLLDKFMEGQTSIEEEDELQEWFAQHEVDEELQTYKDMFKYFDKGMPLQNVPQQEDIPAERKNGKRIAIWIAGLAVAASVAITLIMTFRNNAVVNESSVAQAAAPTDSVKTKDTVIDSIQVVDDDKVDAKNQNEPKKRVKPKRKIKKLDFTPAPPKVYLAKTDTVQTPNEKADEIARTLAELERQAKGPKQKIMLNRVFLGQSLNDIEVEASVWYTDSDEGEDYEDY